MISETAEIARLRVAERVRAAEARARYAEESDGPHGPRHQLAGALRRMADLLEPPARRTPLSVSGR
jgi:hypothetical protein